MKNFHKTNAFSIIVPLLGVILLWYLGMGWLIVLGGLGFGIIFLLRRQSRDKDSTISKLGDNLIKRSIDRDIAKGNMEHKIVNGRHKMEHSPMTGLKNRVLGYTFNKDMDSIKKTALDNSIERGIQPTHVDSKAGRVKDILFEKKGKEDILSQHVNDRKNQQGYNQRNGYNYNQRNGYNYNQSNNYNYNQRNAYNQQPFNQQGYNQQPFSSYNQQPFSSYNQKPFSSYNQQPFNTYNQQPFNNYNEQGYNQSFNNYNQQSGKDMYGANIVGKPINDRVKVYYESDQYGMGRRLRGGISNSYIEGLYHNTNIANKGVSDYYREERTDVYSENFTTLSTDFSKDRNLLKDKQEGLRKILFASDTTLKKVFTAVEDLTAIRKLYIEDLGCVRDEQDLIDTYNDTLNKLDSTSKNLKTSLTKLLNTSEVFDKNSIDIAELRKKLNRELNNQGINNYYNGNVLVEQGEGKVIFDFYELYNQLINMYKNSIESLTTDCRMYLDSRVGKCNNQMIEDFRNNNSELLGDCSKWFYNERLQLDNLVSKALESYKNKYLKYEDELSQQGDMIFEFKTEEDLNKEDKNDYEFLHNNNNFMDTDVFNNSTNHSVNDMFGDTMVEGYNTRN